MSHLWKEIHGDLVVEAWSAHQLAEHFKKPGTPAPEAFIPFIRDKELTIARDPHDGILISISTPSHVGVVHPIDYLIVADGNKLYVKAGPEFELMFAKVPEPQTEKLPDNSREDLEVQRCSRPNCKQKASFMYEDDVRQLPVFRCPQHLAGDICWDAMSPTEVKSLQKLGE